ncbi:hypothetical protein V2J09_023622 [Rumex salicifolius]
MSIPQAPCPANSILYNTSLCACSPGYFFNSTSKSCALFNVSSSEWVVNSGVDYSISFPETIFSFDHIKKFTQSQAVFLEATAIMLLSWLLFCALVRFRKLGDGRNYSFRVRWWISRLDVCFATRHWLDDQKVVKKRKTELGGTFSMASLILFTGLFSALLYHIISKRTIEMHNVRATNAPDLVSYVNDLEFNITAVSSMSCSQLQGLGTLIMGKPGIIGYRGAELSRFANYTCLNTSIGPTINLKCQNCPISWDNVYISWHFVDVPNVPAAAVGFQFNLTAKNLNYSKHVSLVSGKVNNGNVANDNKPITFRGTSANVLQFNLFPRIYHNLHSLKLVQPLFHEFLPGSVISDANQLQSSLQNSSTGLVNTTLFINFLSDYVVEIDNQSILGPVSFLADVGGLFCFSLGICYYLLIQCEYRIKRLRNEDQRFKDIRRRIKAQARWEKLRKYVIYTWGCTKLQEEFNAPTDGGLCSCNINNPFRKHNSFDKRRQQEISLHTISFDKTDRSPEIKGHKEELYLPSNASPRALTNGNRNIPPPPLLPDLSSSAIDTFDIQRSLKSLFEYNVMLRDQLAATQSTLDAITSHSESRRNTAVGTSKSDLS